MTNTADNKLGVFLQNCSQAALPDDVKHTLETWRSEVITEKGWLDTLSVPT